MRWRSSGPPRDPAITFSCRPMTDVDLESEGCTPVPLLTPPALPLPFEQLTSALHCGGSTLTYFTSRFRLANVKHTATLDTVQHVKKSVRHGIAQSLAMHLPTALAAMTAATFMRTLVDERSACVYLCSQNNARPSAFWLPKLHRDVQPRRQTSRTRARSDISCSSRDHGGWHRDDGGLPSLQEG